MPGRLILWYAVLDKTIAVFSPPAACLAPSSTRKAGVQGILSVRPLLFYFIFTGTSKTTLLFCSLVFMNVKKLNLLSPFLMLFVGPAVDDTERVMSS